MSAGFTLSSTDEILIITVDAEDLPGLNLKRIRNDLEMTQTELAHLLTHELGKSWTKITVSKVEKLHRKLSHDEIAAAAQVTGYSLFGFHIPPEQLTKELDEPLDPDTQVYPIAVHVGDETWGHFYNAWDYIERVLQMDRLDAARFRSPGGGYPDERMAFRAEAERRLRKWLEHFNWDLSQFKPGDVIVSFPDGVQVTYAPPGLAMDYGPEGAFESNQTETTDSQSSGEE